MLFISPINNMSTVQKNKGICSKYLYKVDTFSASAQKYIAYYANNYVYIRDVDYTDAATFKTAMSGVMLYYELATPIEIPLNHPMTYKVDKYSTEELLMPTSQTGAPTSTALNADIDYQYRG